MNQKHKLQSLLGFAQNAGAVVSGEQAVETALRRSRAKLVLVAADASENTRNKFEQMARRLNTPLLCLWDKEQLGHCIGKQHRAVAAVTDRLFAASIARLAAANGLSETGTKFRSDADEEDQSV